MNGLDGFLQRFKKLLDSSAGQKKVILDALLKYTNHTFSSPDITIKEGILYVKATPLLRNEMYMKKALILKELNASFTQPLRDIR
jgi:hypothetical protein